LRGRSPACNATDYCAVASRSIAMRAARIVIYAGRSKLRLERAIMAHVIDCYDCRGELGDYLVRIDIKSSVWLVENEDATFEFCVDYSYSGTFGGRGHVCVPVSGNEAKERHEGGGLFISYEVSNWNVTESDVSCDLSVYVTYKLLGIGPESLLEKQHFRGLKSVVS
jgi:hypothetical protein